MKTLINNKSLGNYMKKTFIFMILFFAMLIGANASVTDELLNWQFETGSGSIAFDSSGNDNNGAIQGATWTTSPAKWGAYAIDFDGSGDYVSGLSTEETPNEITISAWVYSTDSGNWQIFEIKDTTETIGVRYDNGLNNLNLKYVNNALADSTMTLENFNFLQNQWYHLVFSINNSDDTISYWRNNVKILDKVNITGGINKDSTLKTLRIAGNQEGTSYLNGVMDSFRVMEGVINDSQVSDLYMINDIYIPEPIVEDNTTQATDTQQTDFIVDYNPKQGDNLTQKIDFNALLNHTATCEVYIDNKLSYTEKDIQAFSFTKLFSDFNEHEYFTYCYYYFNDTKYYDMTPYISFTPKPFDPFDVTFYIQGVDFDVNNVSLYVVSPCMERGVSAIGTDIQPYRAVYNPDGIRFAKVLDGVAIMNVTKEVNEYCLFNGRVNVNGEGKTNDYDIVDAYKQVNLGEIKTPNNVTNNSYTISLEQFDIYNVANPKAWGLSWSAVIGGLILLILGVAILFVGVHLQNGKIVIGGVILCLSAFGISFTGFVGVLA